jgi:hypothetical protein
MAAQFAEAPRYWISTPPVRRARKEECGHISPFWRENSPQPCGQRILDVLTEAGKSELADGILYLSQEHVQKIAAAVGAPQAFAQASGAGDAREPLLTVKHKIAELKAFAATRGR